MAKHHRPGKLAVILHADIVGSTVLVQQDERLAHERIQETFHRFSDIITQYHGRVCELRGDALLAEFNRTSNAVTAALAFQSDQSEYNAQLSDNILPVVRVGIAMGEAIIADNTITGACVVVAQRLEQLAKPGGICIQGAAYETVPKRHPFDYKSMGEKTLKGFEQPVRAYSVMLKAGKEIPAPEPSDMQETPPIELSNKPTIAVLPFTNMSADPEQEYFSDGITEDIITELSRFRSIFVIARNSSFHYKGQSPKVQEIGKELGVQYIVEGSVRTVGKRVRVTAQLVESTDGKHLWADKYDRDLEDIFAVQDELVRAIVTFVGGYIDFTGKARASRLGDERLRAYDLFLRARAAQDRNTEEDYQHAARYLERAILLDPGFAQAYQALSLVYFMQWMAHWVSDRDAAFAKSTEAARKSVELDPADSGGYSRLGTIQLNRREFNDSGRSFRKAISLNPNDSQAFALFGVYLTAIGEPEQGIEQFNKAMRLNPFEPKWFRWSRGIAFFTARRYEDAISDLASIDSPINEVRGWLAASYALAGRLDEARAIREMFLQTAEQEMAVFPGRKLSAWENFWHGAIEYENEANFQHLYDGLRKAGLSD